MKKLIAFVCIMMLGIAGIAAQDNIAGDWTPDGASWLGDIKIKSMGGDKYKIRLDAERGAVTATETLNNGVIYLEYENMPAEYGEYWVQGGKILHGQRGGSYGSFGEVSGWLGNNQNYYYTSSRHGCATMEKNLCCIKLVFTQEEMTAYFKLRGEYYKNGQAMFYQESNWSPVASYTCW